jgi:secondary thiamine-phosphate synthase enzyme
MRDTYRPVKEGVAVTGATLTAVETRVITVRTGSRPTVVDLTAQANAFVQGRGDGLLHVFTPHATAGLAIIETGAGSDVDLLAALDETLPADDRWRHRHGSAGHGRDHVLPAFIAPYASLPVIDGRIALGTWQSICLVDPNADNPTRQVRFSFLAG